ncbi:CAP domain-containing protein [Streptomyces marokkonensis]|uniref:CAP domain-containing protein n=1 Tax=Streptomyces marokkonensis TaxID=324855 RepID=UPI0011F1A55A|nr:CAP domain-containing protein [Streptomyces marokkonensis]
MGKHRHQQQYRRTVVAAVAIGVIGIPSVAMACTDWPGEGERQDRNTAAPVADRDRWDGPDWYREWSGQHESEPSAAPSGTPAATTAPSKPAAPKRGSARPSHKPERTAPEAPTSRPTTAAPRPTTAAPKPTTAAPRPSTSAPEPGATASSPAPTGGTQASGAVARVVELVNAERGKAGCSPVKVNATLTEAAQNHSEDMAASGSMSHTGSDGSSPGDRITRAGYSWSTYGENVAYGYSTPEQVMQGWMTSPGHKANILNCAFKEIGVGLAQPGSYWTQDFGTAR